MIINFEDKFSGWKLRWHMQSRDEKEPLLSERIITTIEKVWVPVKLPKCLLDLGAAWNWLNLGQSTRWSRYRCFANMLEKHSCLPKMIYLRILSKIPYSFFLFAWILNFRQKWTQISVFSSQRYLAQLHGDHFQAWPKSKGLKTKTGFILDINMEILDTNSKLLLTLYKILTSDEVEATSGLCIHRGIIFGSLMDLKEAVTWWYACRVDQNRNLVGFKFYFNSTLLKLIKNRPKFGWFLIKIELRQL